MDRAIDRLPALLPSEKSTIIQFTTACSRTTQTGKRSEFSGSRIIRKTNFNFMKNMLSKNETNRGFVCEHCGEVVAPAEKTARNHCPHCLWSLHVDAQTPGDRAALCDGAMEPAAIYQKHGAWVVIHRCLRCGKEQPNHCAEDDNFQILIDLTQKYDD